MVRGVLTAASAEPLKSRFLDDREPPAVWPYAEGTVRGISLAPLYKGAPKAALHDPSSPDGKRLATASSDQSAKVWDAASGQDLFTFKGHTLYVNSVAWSLDGKRLATASSDGTVQIYAMDVRLLLDLARKRVTREFTPDECKGYFQSEKCPPLP